MTDIFYIDQVRKIIDEEFDRNAVIFLRDSLNEIIEATKPKPEVCLRTDLPKTQVYKRIDTPEEIKNGWTKSGYLTERPWMCTGVPEDVRETCHKTWNDAMAWATMPSEKRIELIEYEAQFEMGQ